MDIPPQVWEKFGQMIHQDFMWEHGDFTSGLISVFQRLSEDEVDELFRYIRKITEEKISLASKMQIWMDSGAGFVPAKKDVSHFLGLLLAEIESFQSASSSCKF